MVYTPSEQLRSSLHLLYDVKMGFGAHASSYENAMVRCLSSQKLFFLHGQSILQLPNHFL